MVGQNSKPIDTNDFNRLRESEDVWRYGISYGWLQERFDCSKHRQFKDLPCHARIGIGIHARRVSNEESTLLSDAFFLLVQARERYAKLMDVAESLKSRSIKISLESYDATSALTSAACTFSRLGVLTAAAFVETFVNSVGWNEAVSRGFPEGDLDTLKGLEKGRFLSLEKKLEQIPPIIRGDKIRTIIISDDKQIKEPFKSFLKTTKEVRNASMHYAPGKAAIIRTPQQWLALVEDAVKQSVSVAREFWSACYPDKDQPMYLASLYYEGLLKEATDRLSNAGSSMAISD